MDKYRGKKILDNKWVYGIYVKQGNNHFITPKINKNGYAKCISVNPKTICRYTGLLDYNKHDVYEGDIVQESNGGLGEIVWDKDTFLIRFHYAYISTENMNKYIVIGNIWDDKELLQKI